MYLRASVPAMFVKKLCTFLLLLCAVPTGPVLPLIQLYLMQQQHLVKDAAGQVPNPLSLASHTVMSQPKQPAVPE